MPRGKNTKDLSMLSMALVGYELEKKKIDERIREVRAQLAGQPSIDGQTPKRRKLSVAARKRIGAAQKKRWAEHRKALARAGK